MQLLDLLRPLIVAASPYLGPAEIPLLAVVTMLDPHKTATPPAYTAAANAAATIANAVGVAPVEHNTVATGANYLNMITQFVSGWESATTSAFSSQEHITLAFHVLYMIFPSLNSYLKKEMLDSVIAMIYSQLHATDQSHVAATVEAATNQVPVMPRITETKATSPSVPVPTIRVATVPLPQKVTTKPIAMPEIGAVLVQSIDPLTSLGGRGE